MRQEKALVMYIKLRFENALYSPPILHVKSQGKSVLIESSKIGLMGHILKLLLNHLLNPLMSGGNKKVTHT